MGIIAPQMGARIVPGVGSLISRAVQLLSDLDM